MTDDSNGASTAGSQTLDRGIRMLEALADEPAQTIAELAVRLGVHRSIAYRILRTLEAHGLVVRDVAGRVSLGPRMAALARGVAADLQSAALPELTLVANDLGMTAFVVVLDHHECVTLISVEPRHAAATVAQRPGTRHALSRGAPGIAIQALLTEAQWSALGGHGEERREAEVARETGYATSADEVIPGVKSVAASFDVPGTTPAAVAVVYVGEQNAAAIGARLSLAATRMSRKLG